MYTDYSGTLYVSCSQAQGVSNKQLHRKLLRNTIKIVAEKNQEYRIAIKKSISLEIE